MDNPGGVVRLRAQRFVKTRVQDIGKVSGQQGSCARFCIFLRSRIIKGLNPNLFAILTVEGSKTVMLSFV